MLKRNHVDIGVVLKHLFRMGRHPWIGSKLFKLEAEKHLFNLLYPQHKNGMANKIRQVSIRITDICNLRCHTCGQWGESGFLHGKDLKLLKQAEVTPERYLKIFSDLIENGHRPMIYFWGGEPMLYGGILDLIEKTSGLGLPVAIATNGTELARFAPRMVKAPLFLMQVSIDGHRAELHDRLRPSATGSGNFSRIVEGLEMLNTVRKRDGRGLPLIASLTVISRDNIRHLVDIYEAFRDKVDLFVFYLSWWIDGESAKRHEKDFSRRFGMTPVKHRGWIGDWKPDDFKYLSRQIRRLTVRSRSWHTPPVTLIPPIFGEKNLEAYYTDHRSRFGFDQCVSIFQVTELNSNGDVSPCRDYHDYIVGNIKEKTMTELWNSNAYIRFRQSLAREGLMPVCSRCCGLMGY